MSCCLGFLYSVSFHNLPFLVQSQKPGSPRFLLSVQHRWVDYIIVFKNRFFKLAFRGKKFLLREKEEMKVRGRNGSLLMLPLPSSINLPTMANESALGQGWPDVPLPVGINCPYTFINIQWIEKKLLLLGIYIYTHTHIFLCVCVCIYIGKSMDVL